LAPPDFFSDSLDGFRFLPFLESMGVW